MKMLRHEIPDDIITEILLRLPVPAILRFRAVSKFHRALIDSSDFIRQHYHLAVKQTTACGSYFLCEGWSEGGGWYWMEFESAYMAKLDRRVYAGHPSLELHNFHLVGCCMGILCFIYVSDELGPPVILFWNPTTRRHRKVIQNHGIGLVPSVGYDSVADDIKLLLIPDGKICAAVYSWRTESWKHIQGFNNQWPNLGLIDDGRRPVFVEGTNCIHMAASDSDSHKLKIVAFDFSTESFSLAPVPPGIHSASLRPASLCGCLCLYSLKTDPFEVWMMKEYGVEESWAKIFSFDSPSRYMVTPLDLMNNGRRLLLWLGSWWGQKELGFYIYDDDKKTLEYVTCKGSQFGYHQPSHFPYTPSIRLP